MEHHARLASPLSEVDAKSLNFSFTMESETDLLNVWTCQLPAKIEKLLFIIVFLKQYLLSTLFIFSYFYLKQYLLFTVYLNPSGLQTRPQLV